MVDKKDPKGVNKSEEIRKLAKSLEAKGEKPRPVVIIAALKKQGVVVSSPQVSMVLKRMGFRPRPRKQAGAVGTAVKVRGGAISVDELLAAKKLVGQFGGADRAMAALQALKQFEG
jgi:hypothetical protein